MYICDIPSVLWEPSRRMLTSASSAHVGAKQLPRSFGSALLTGPPGYRFHIAAKPKAVSSPQSRNRHDGWLVDTSLFRPTYSEEPQSSARPVNGRSNNNCHRLTHALLLRHSTDWPQPQQTDCLDTSRMNR
ncbi:unnamed protein product [Protopolystoma xenopodis]|uniref:Uncharacterized protein n=1 Tax=Protopolystoma xenopodis TaxID=117903 RepID=A0A448XCA9_9PLAT|nr:unnamed protein product [Protopolystoma xenopodis]